MKQRILISLMLLFSSLLFASPEGEYIGVDSCAASSCHGATREQSSQSVRQNEYSSWFRYDRHSQAFQTLRTPQAKLISAALGAVPATQNPDCLGCHSTNVPAQQRGDDFNMAEGITCEACHGPAGNWLKTHHQEGASHQDNVARGLNPLDQPAVLAQQCLGCHQSNPSSMLTHKLMAAGHPRVSFELATFISAQPAHFSRDADYVERKGNTQPLQIWLQGQITAATGYLSLLENKLAHPVGLSPDLSLFECRACHRPATPEGTPSQQIGELQLDTSSLEMISVATRAFNWTHHEQLVKRITEWKLATTSISKLTAASQALKTLLERLDSDIAFHHKFGPQADTNALLASLQQQAQAGEFKQWQSAEQAYYLLRLAASDAQLYIVDAALAALADPTHYKPNDFAAALAPLGQPAN